MWTNVYSPVIYALKGNGHKQEYSKTDLQYADQMSSMGKMLTVSRGIFVMECCSGIYFQEGCKLERRSRTFFTWPDLSDRVLSHSLDSTTFFFFLKKSTDLVGYIVVGSKNL
jgi:hypothetical protein